MINLNSKRDIFKSKEFNREFDRLIVSDGPLSYILNRYPNIPAKGGIKFPEYKDTSYFIHVINTLYIGGIMLERDLMHRNVDLSQFNKYIKLFFAAAIAHDFNKLEGNGTWKSDDYIQLLNNKQQVLLKIILPYFGEYNINEITEDLKYIILNVENGSKDSVNEVDISDKKDLYYLTRFISKGDSISSIMSKNKPDLEIMNEIKGNLENENYIFNNMNSITFQKIPQILLRNVIIRYVEDYLSKNGDIILKSPDWIIFENVENDLKQEKLKDYLIEKLNALNNDIDNILKSYPPSNNQINISFGEKISVTPEVLVKFMDEYKERLLLYQKINELDKQYNIFNVLKSWKFDILDVNKVKYYAGIDDFQDEDINIKSMYVRTAILRRMELDHDKTINTDSESNELIKNGVPITKIESITKKTLLSLAFSFIHRSDIVNTYNQALSKVSDLINTYYKNNSDLKNHDEFYGEIVDRILSLDIRIKTDIGSKEDLCIQCGGVYHNRNLSRINSFGIKATSGTGTKISVLEYNDKYNGKICSVCGLENSLRQQNFEETNTQCIQMYIGDFLPPVDLISILKNFENTLKEKNITGVLMNEKDKVYQLEIGSKRKIAVMDYHNIAFINKPKDSLEEFDLLYKTLRIVKETGMKIKLSTLFISGGTFYNTFKWDSPPSWVKDLKLDELRIDQIDYSIYILRTIEVLGSLGRGYKDIPGILSKIIQNKMNIYSIIWNNISTLENKGSKIDDLLMGNDNFPGIKKYEEMFVNMKEINFVEKLAEIACNIDNDGPKSNNDNTWMIRTAFEVYGENYLDKNKKINYNNTADVAEKISGKLWEISMRRNKGSSEKNKNSCVDFGSTFIEGISEVYGKMPKQAIRRDIISQFALLYNIKKWKEIKNKKGEKNE